MTFRRKKNTIFRGFQRLMIIFASGGESLLKRIWNKIDKR